TRATQEAWNVPIVLTLGRAWTARRVGARTTALPFGRFRRAIALPFSGNRPPTALKLSLARRRLWRTRPRSLLGLALTRRRRGLSRRCPPNGRHGAAAFLQSSGNDRD